MDLINDVPVIIGAKEERFTKLRTLFKNKFNNEPSFIVRVPGRVNLIGEHIDYCGFNVLPMAIEQDCLLAVGFNQDNMISLTNMESDKFTDYESNLDNYIINIPPSWFHYVLCGLEGAKDAFKSSDQHLSGLNIAVWGTIPASSGLSSSSALVTASLIAAIHSVQSDLSKSPTFDKVQIANIAASCEKYIGTQGGAMDQSIAMLARSGYAKLIEFEPTLTAYDVCLPLNCCFFFSHSGITCNKAATDQFNARVFETKIAALMIADHCHIEPGSDVTCFTLSQIKKILSKSYDEMIRITTEAIEPGKVYKVTELLEYFDVNNENELAYLLSNGSKNTLSRMQSVLANYGNGFKIHDRAIHVFSEAQRVEKVVQLCSNKNSLDNQKVLQEFGRLMNESHSSCKNLYECSCEEVDKLVKAARSFGAIGARMTGAGWGGGIISLVPHESVQQFEQKITSVSSFTFKSLPSHGASIYL